MNPTYKGSRGNCTEYRLFMQRLHEKMDSAFRNARNAFSKAKRAKDKAEGGEEYERFLSAHKASSKKYYAKLRKQGGKGARKDIEEKAKVLIKARQEEFPSELYHGRIVGYMLGSGFSTYQGEIDSNTEAMRQITMCGGPVTVGAKVNFCEPVLLQEPWEGAREGKLRPKWMGLEATATACGPAGRIRAAVCDVMVTEALLEELSQKQAVPGHLTRKLKGLTNGGVALLVQRKEGYVRKTEAQMQRLVAEVLKKKGKSKIELSWKHRIRT
eukprot:CAMPEP_0182487696 /NCGR_PEP_ID=MMETSP1319-20130603/48038_1 /TAXON_ID=172717 /ORGANISM="Bolidomonas pacifica, Strain RCC208" /LENGTH=269 /DNA_ID=CAMNT_0024689823 /DNA_START=1018 /DNA_END=1824 /DNA_ORIENTATION=+